jgi:thioredoxin-dependent peroxiredoxin
MTSVVKFKEGSVTVCGSFPRKGFKLPDLTLVDTNLEKLSCASFKEDYLLIYFLPSVDTSVCGNSLKKLNEIAAKHKLLKAICVSADLPFAQSRSVEANGLVHLTFLSTYLCEQVKIAYGVAIADSPLVGLCARGVILAEKNGNVLYSQLVPDIATEPDYEGLTFAITQCLDG